MDKRYVVFNGKQPGVYDRWEKAHSQVDGFSGACYKGYRNKEEASNAFDEYVKPESEEYGSGGYGRKPSYERCDDEGYGGDDKRYVVFNGTKPGVYDRWQKAHSQVNGFSGACYKGYRNKGEASSAFDEYMKPESEDYGSGGYGRKPEYGEERVSYGRPNYEEKPGYKHHHHHHRKHYDD